MAAIVMIRDDPPKEMKGSGMPVTGRTPMTAPMLITAWLVIQVVMPTARRLPNRSGARVAARRPNQARAKNRPRSTTAPTRPSSSPTTEKMKSVWALGRSPHFWRPPPRPRPKTWPEPSPISDCHTW